MEKTKKLRLIIGQKTLSPIKIKPHPVSVNSIRKLFIFKMNIQKIKRREKNAN